MYQAPPAKIDLIPHGIPDVTFVAPDHYKGQFGVGGKKVLLTFGLLSPNKGIEHVLHALPDIVAEFPDIVYIVLGATHPHELRTRGEAYRLGLEAITRNNKLEDNVIFHNRFVELKELTEFIGAADLYITPYLDEAQITSGTLAYAFGAGKAVISTPYWHAAELLSDQRGVLVPFARSGGNRARGEWVAARWSTPENHERKRLQVGPHHGVEQHGGTLHGAPLRRREAERQRRHARLLRPAGSRPGRTNRPS